MLNYTILYQTVPYNTKYQEIWNSYNSAIFQAVSSNFYMVADCFIVFIL